MIKTIHGILLILYIIVCVALTVVVILQEGKQAGLTSRPLPLGAPRPMIF